MPTIRAVIFDYGLVLSGPPDAAVYAEMAHLLAVDAPQLDRAYWQFRDAYDLGQLDGNAYWLAVGGALERTLDTSTLDALLVCDVSLWAQPNAPMIAWAQRLQRAGVRTAILSNLGDAMEAGLRARLPWLADFHHCTFSHWLGVAKPAAAIYRHALAGVGVPASETLFVDDRAVNIAAAREAGIHAIRYDGHDSFLSELKALGLAELYNDQQSQR